MYTGLLLAPLWVVAGIGLAVWIILSEILPEKMPRTGAVLKAGWLSLFGKWSSCCQGNIDLRTRRDGSGCD